MVDMWTRIGDDPSPVFEPYLEEQMLTRLVNLILIVDSSVRGPKVGAHKVRSNLFMKFVCPVC